MPQSLVPREAPRFPVQPLPVPGTIVATDDRLPVDVPCPYTGLVRTYTIDASLTPSPGDTVIVRHGRTLYARKLDLCTILPESHEILGVAPWVSVYIGR